MSLYQYERDGDAQALIRRLRDADAVAVRERAAELLGRLGDHEDRRDVVDALVEAAQRDEDAVTAAAVDALDELGGEAIEQLIADVADLDTDGAADWVRADAYARALRADLAELRMAAAAGLGDVGGADAVEPLADRLRDDDPRVRVRAARACGEIGDPRAVPALAAALEDPQSGVRVAAARALGSIGTDDALDALLALYDDESEAVRRVAVAGFGHFETDDPVAYLVAALGDDSAAVRRTAVYSLIQLLSNVPRDRSHDLRESVVDSLSATDDRTVVEPLVEIVRETTQEAQRRNTAWLLGRVTDPETPAVTRAVVDALIEVLADGERMTRQFAATSLCDIGGAYAERELLSLVRDGSADTEARTRAIFALGKLGGDPSREALADLVDDAAEEAVREQAFSALSKLGGHAA